MENGRRIMSAFLLLNIFTLIISIQSQDKTIESRISGGSLVMPNEIPYQVSIQFLTDGTYIHRCGGVIVDPKRVLTTALCLADPSLDIRTMRIVGGTNNITCDNKICSGQIRSVELVIPHEEFARPSPDDNDIAIVVLAENFVFDAKVSAIDFSTETFETGENCTASGWGISDGSHDMGSMLKVEMAIYDFDNCSDFYTERVTDKMMCAGYDEGNQGICNGDQGGPLVCRGKLAGLASFGYFCASPNHPAVFTRVSEYVDWFWRTTKDYQCMTDGSSIDARVFRGPLADIEDTPYQAAILRKENRYFMHCGAVIISLKHVLSTATCVFEIRNWEWVLKDQLLVVASIDTIPFGGDSEFSSTIQNATAPDEFYRSNDLQYNIAIITLTGDPTPFQLTPKLQPILLQREKVEICDKCLISGWGTGNIYGPPPQLKWASVSVLNQTVCQSRFQNQDLDNVICTYEGGPGTCARDQGGPLVCNGRLAGIILMNNELCIKANTPSLYVDVAKHKDWIAEHVPEFVPDYQCQPNGSIIYERINGGSNVDISRIPYQVSIKTRGFNGATHRCTGVVLTMQHILTTAACVSLNTNATVDASSILTVGGLGNYSQLGTTEQLRDIRRIHVHESFLSNRRKYNIAVLQLTENFTASDTLQAITLRDTETNPCEACTISGWDRNSMGGLTNTVWTSVPTFNHSTCKMMLNSDLDGEVCTYSGGPGPCWWDEGGPLVCNGRLTGMAIRENGYCSTELPSIYLEVKNHLKWIEDAIKYNNSVIKAPIIILIIFSFLSTYGLKLC